MLMENWGLTESEADAFIDQHREDLEDPEDKLSLALFLAFGALAAAHFVKWLLSLGGSKKKREEREELIF